MVTAGLTAGLLCHRVHQNLPTSARTPVFTVFVVTRLQYHLRQKPRSGDCARNFVFLLYRLPVPNGLYRPQQMGSAANRSGWLARIRAQIFVLQFQKREPTHIFGAGFIKRPSLLFFFQPQYPPTILMTCTTVSQNRLPQ